jgi:hypothetical protein
MSALTPGLYRATVRGVPGESIVLAGVGVTGDKDVMFSLSKGDVRRCYVFENARPLIVLDFDSDVCADVVGDLRRVSTFLAAHGLGTAFIADIADQIEAQTKPARIPEPGLWGVVEAAASSSMDNGGTGGERVRWVRYPEGWCGVVYCERPWDDLIDPAEIREGLS